MFSGKKGLGISSKITVLLAVLLLINALAAGIFSYAFYRSGNIEAHGQTAISIAQSVGISGEKILRITQAMEKTEEWLEMKSRLNTLTDSTDAIAVYVLGLPARESLLYPFLALSNAEINIGSVKHADDMAPEISFAYSLAMPVSSGVYESDGEYIITGFVPVFSPDGEVVGVVGADISAGKMRSDAFSFAARVALISVLLIAALSAAAYILSEKLFGRRLRLVADAAVKLAAGDTSLPQTGTGKDEAGIIAGNLSVICGSINSLTAGILGFEAQLPDDDYDKLEGIFSPLKQSISKSKSIIENVDLLIYVSDAKTYDILFANRKMLETVGLTSEEIKDKKCWQVFYKGMAGPCPFCPNPKLLADNNEINLYKSERYDRFAKKWYLTQSTIIKWPDGKTAHFKTATDITKQKEYEIGMKNLSAIIAVEDAGIIVKDKLGIVNEWNIGAQNILGYLREEVIGKTSKDFAPYEGHAIIDRTYEQLLNGEHITNIEEIRLHKDGREINCSISYTPILDDDGIVTGSVSIFHDITEKKKIEKEHKQLESTLLNLFDNLSNGFALFELFTDGGGEENLRLFMANKAFRNFSDKKKEKDLTGLAFAEVFGAAPEEISYYITVAKTGGGRTNESYNYVLKKHISEVVFSPSRGQVALLLTDRTHLVKAQEALLKREKDLAMLFGSMTAGFCMGQVIYDADNKPEDVVFEIVNSAYETLEDFAPGTLLGKKLLEISPDEHEEHFKVYADVAINRRKATFSKYIASKGKTLDVVCYSPSEGYFACIENDVTEREKKDQELKKAYRDTQAILGEIPAPICIISRESDVILGCNKAFVRLCVAVNENELKNSKIGNLLITEEKDTDMKKLFGSGKFKGFLKKHDGSLVEVEVFAKPFVYEEQIAYAVCCIDISQQRLQEEILREAALNAAETSRLKSMFLANMSHEIRTPMNGIIGLTELALDSDNLTEKTADYLNKIKISATGLLGIINDILDISKIEAGKTELETLPFIFGDIFKSCETIVADMKEKENEVKLLLNYSEISFEKVKGDPTKLRQIFMNLLSNAVKFTNEGYVELSAVLIKKDEHSLTARFAVKDTGIGMSPSQIRSVLEPFSQADISTTRKYGGTGLGLSITNNLLDLMGGQLSVESMQGVGSTFAFTLTFPRAEQFAAHAAYETNNVRSADRSKKPIFSAEALVCEDNVINKQVIEENLLRIGIKPVVAENGKIGVNMAKTRMRTGKPFDIILMDIHMPVMDGLEAMQKLTEAGNTVPVIAMTANAMREDRELIIQSGMSDYICKPFTAWDLWDCLLKYLVPVRYDEIHPGKEKDADASKEVIDGEAGLEKAAGDPRLYNKIKNDFYFENRDAIENIENAVKVADFRLAHRIAHTLKGVSMLIGATALSEAAFTLEKTFTAGTNDEKALELLKERLDEVLSLLLPGAEAQKAAIGKVSNTGTDVDKAHALIRRLEPLLEDGSSEATDLADEIKEAFSQELCGELVALLLDYEFDTALKELHKIKQQLENN